MTFSRKAQTATEYLIILAVVIVIALIVVSTLGGIPGVGRNGQQKSNEIYWKTQDLSIQSYSVSETNGVAIVMQNRVRHPITVVSFKLDGQELITGMGDFFEVGDELTLNLDQTNAPSCTAGESFSYDVEVQYSTDLTAQVYTFSGSGRKLTGTCAN